MKQTQLIPLEAKNAPLTVMRSALDKSIYQMAMKERPERQWKVFRYKKWHTAEWDRMKSKAMCH